MIGKLVGFAGVASMITARGLPLAPVLPVAAMAPLAVGSVLLISGRRTRLGAILLLLAARGDGSGPAPLIELHGIGALPGAAARHERTHRRTMVSPGTTPSLKRSRSAASARGRP